jgi:hypothetical protein
LVADPQHETGEATPALQASIRSYLDRELSLSAPYDGYELRYGDLTLARMENPRQAPTVSCATRDGDWLFTRFRGGHTAATDARGGDDVVARYKAKLLPGGTIELPSGPRIKLRPPSLNRTWKAHADRRAPVLDFRRHEDEWLVRFGEAARDVYHLPLLTMFAFHAVLVETDAPTTGGS